MIKTTALQSPTNIERRVANIILAMAGIALCVSVASGFIINHEFTTGNYIAVEAFNIVHLIAGLCFIFFGSLHIYYNRRWFYKLLSDVDLNWAERAECRLIPIYTMLFAAVSVSAILILCGVKTLIDFHRGCALLFTVFAVVHIAIHIRNYLRAC